MKNNNVGILLCQDCMTVLSPESDRVDDVGRALYLHTLECSSGRVRLFDARAVMDITPMRSKLAEAYGDQPELGTASCGDNNEATGCVRSSVVAEGGIATPVKCLPEPLKASVFHRAFEILEERSKK